MEKRIYTNTANWGIVDDLRGFAGQGISWSVYVEKMLVTVYSCVCQSRSVCCYVICNAIFTLLFKFLCQTYCLMPTSRILVSKLAKVSSRGINSFPLGMQN